MRRALILLVAAALAAPAAAHAAPRTSIFFYPWYGTAERDGAFLHWQQASARPPEWISSSFYPARGVYSSGDMGVLRSQMREIRRIGVDEVATSWWGRGSVEDARLPAVVASALAEGLRVAAHVEPYGGRTAASVAADVEYLAAYGIEDVYVYGAEAIAAADWRAATAAIGETRLFAQTVLVGWAAAAGFDGVYTYDVLVHGGNRFGRLCSQARAQRLLCAPSVGPGFDARRAVAGLGVKPRRHGRTYDAMWTAAIRARPDVVTITSYNEWHEGTQIEAARARPGYESYAGAWGLRGAAAEEAYLRRTAHWTARLTASSGR